MDIAQLGIEVQSGPVKSAINDLKEFANAGRVAERAASGLADSSGKFSSTEIKAMASAMGGVEKTSSAAAKALAGASLAAQRTGAVGASGVKALAQSAGAARAQVQNLSYQMQDIITMMATGQSPFMLLAQQLGQVTQNGGQLNGVWAAIKQTLTGLISPLGLATTAFVVLGSAAISYFSEWMSKGSEANKTVEEQAKLVEAVAEQWGKAVPALESYVQALKDAKSTADLLSATDSLADQQWIKARDLVGELNVEISDVYQRMADNGMPMEAVSTLMNAWNDLSEGVEKGKNNTQAMEIVTNSLASAFETTGISAIEAFQQKVADLGQTMAGATRQAMSFREEALQALLVGKNGPSLGQLSPLFSENGKFYNGDNFTPSDPPTPTRRPLIELEGLPKVGGGRQKTAKQSGYETATASMAEQTRALQAQTAAQASLNPLVNDYGFAVAKAKAETDLLLAAEKDKKSITPELTAQIKAQAEGYAQAVVEQNRLTEATKKAQETMQFVKNTTAGFINDLRDGLRNGESFWEAFGSAALSVLDRITDRLLNQVLDAVFQVSNAGSSSGGGFLSSLFGGLFGGGNGGFASLPKIGPVPSSRYAAGTASARAGMALVGENGPEVVRFGGGEQVVPNHRLGLGMSGGAANSNTVNDNRKYSIDARGAGPGVEEQIVAALKQYDKQAQRNAAQRTAASMKTVARRGMYK